jgi:L-asparaginase II
VRIVRSGVQESVHLGHVAICDADGRLLASLGDPSRLVFARSCLKPLQAAASLRHIEAELPDELVAIMCGSHNGEPPHVSAVRRLLRSGGASEAELRCPPARPSAPSAALSAGRMRRVYHNCSGKHAGMVVAAGHAGWGSEGYLAPSHRLQREILRAVRRGTGVEHPRIGVDGCGAPVFGVPLAAMATLFARLGRPERLGTWAPTARRAVLAMRMHPFLVAGSGRTDTLLMQRVPGLIAKVGAEALHCAALLDEGIGLAVKIADGGDRASGIALVHALRLLGAVTPAQVEELGPVAVRPVTGGGVPVGEIRADFRLHRP